MQRSLRVKLPIDWQDLVQAVQGVVVAEEDLRPLLRLDNGALSCRAMMGDDPVDYLVVPVKGADRSLEQRRTFVEALCEPGLRGAMTDALEGPDPFHAFDKVLATVPIEASRWIEEERISDVQYLCGWLRRAGVEPDPEPGTSRKIIEFPIRRETT